MKTILSILLVLVELTCVRGQIAGSSYGDGSHKSRDQIKINFQTNGKFSETSAEVPKSGTGTWKFEKDTLTLQRNRPPFKEQFVFKDTLTLISILKINPLILRRRERSSLRNGGRREYNYTRKGKLKSINTYDERSRLRIIRSFGPGNKYKNVPYHGHGKKLFRFRIRPRKRISFGPYSLGGDLRLYNIGLKQYRVTCLCNLGE